MNVEMNICKSDTNSVLMYINILEYIHEAKNRAS